MNKITYGDNLLEWTIEETKKEIIVSINKEALTNKAILSLGSNIFMVLLEAERRKQINLQNPN